MPKSNLQVAHAELAEIKDSVTNEILILKDKLQKLKSSLESKKDKKILSKTSPPADKTSS